MNTRRTVLSLLFTLALQAGMPTIVVNNSGPPSSDTAASGAPSAFGPFSAVATCHTNGAASTTIQWAANPLAGVPVDGTAVLWLATAAGRRFSVITARAANTVTVEDSFNIPAGTPVDCACGGKRLTITATGLIADIKGTTGTDTHGWTISIESTGTNYVSGVTLTAGATVQGCTIKGASTSPRPIVEGTADAILLAAVNCDVEDLQFINTNAGKTASTAITCTGAQCEFKNNIIGGSGSSQGFFQGILMGGAIPNAGFVWGNEIRFNVRGIQVSGYWTRILWNYIHGNTTTGIRVTETAFIFRNLFSGNQVAITVAGAGFGGPQIVENTIDSSVSHGIDFGAFAGASSLVNNQITNNGGFGVTCTAATNGCGGTQQRNVGLVAFNNYFGNSSGARNNWLVGDSETAAIPQYFGGTDFCPTTTVIQAVGGPPGDGQNFFNSSTPSDLWQGVCQRRSGGVALNIGI